MDLSMRWIGPAAGAAALLLAAADGAAAQNLMDRARDRCARATANTGWTVVDRERERELDDGRIQIRMRLRNQALVSGFDCTYDPGTDTARIPSLGNATYTGGQGGYYPGGNGGYYGNESVLRSRARARCESLVANSGWRYVNREREERLNDGRFLVRQRLQRGTLASSYDCYYDPRTDQAVIPSFTSGTGDAALAERARAACTDLARDLGYRVVDYVAAERTRERVELRMRLRRYGRTESHDCTYNARRDVARIPSLNANDRDDRYDDDGRGETQAQVRARSRCSVAARDVYRYEVVRVGDARAQTRDTYEVTLQVRRSSSTRAFDVECRYDDRTGRADIVS